ncbi:MAG TPA: hypothetical protein VEW42_01695 [Candidatus Eisenbacteria bacterium]|nr:hypothetical protein [Candidatus Eisenbacteria bacterium]
MAISPGGPEDALGAIGPSIVWHFPDQTRDVSHKSLLPSAVLEQPSVTRQGDRSAITDNLPDNRSGNGPRRRKS